MRCLVRGHGGAAEALTVKEALNSVCGAPHDADTNFLVACLVNPGRYAVGRTPDNKRLYRTDALPQIRCAAALVGALGPTERAALQAVFSGGRSAAAASAEY